MYKHIHFSLKHLHTAGNLDNTLASPVNHVTFDHNRIIHEQKD